MLNSIIAGRLVITIFGLIGLFPVLRRFQANYATRFRTRYTRFITNGISLIAVAIATAHAVLVVGWLVVGPDWIFDAVFRTAVLGLLSLAMLGAVVVVIVVVLGFVEDNLEAATNIERES